MITIPILDLKAEYRTLKAEIDAAVQQVLASGQFILGENVRKLEEEIARSCGVPHAVGVASGTDALHLALRACRIGPGDEVLTSPLTFAATAEAICYTGARPVFVDIDRRTYTMDPHGT